MSTRVLNDLCASGGMQAKSSAYGKTVPPKRAEAKKPADPNEVFKPVLQACAVRSLCAFAVRLLCVYVFKSVLQACAVCSQHIIVYGPLIHVVASCCHRYSC